MLAIQPDRNTWLTETAAILQNKFPECSAEILKATNAMLNKDIFA
jgi:hypothetical protein